MLTCDWLHTHILIYDWLHTHMLTCDWVHTHMLTYDWLDLWLAHAQRAFVNNISSH